MQSRYYELSGLPWSDLVQPPAGQRIISHSIIIVEVSNHISLTIPRLGSHQSEADQPHAYCQDYRLGTMDGNKTPGRGGRFVKVGTDLCGLEALALWLRTRSQHGNQTRFGRTALGRFHASCSTRRHESSTTEMFSTCLGLRVESLANQVLPQISIGAYVYSHSVWSHSRMGRHAKLVVHSYPKNHVVPVLGSRTNTNFCLPH